MTEPRRDRDETRLDIDETREPLPVPEAAKRRGLSIDAVRMRLRRGTMQSVEITGKKHVLVPRFVTVTTRRDDDAIPSLEDAPTTQNTASLSDNKSIAVRAVGLAAVVAAGSREARRWVEGKNMAIQTCPHCQAVIDAGDQFCGSCGARLSSPKRATPPSALTQPGAHPAMLPEQAGCLDRVLKVGCASVIVLTIIVGIVAAFGGHNNP